MGSERMRDMWQKIASVCVRITREGESKEEHVKEQKRSLSFEGKDALICNTSSRIRMLS